MDRTVNVIDMYHGNRVALPDFAALKRSGVYAIIHKASQGLHFADPVYAVRRQAAEAAGILWGAYHFLDASDPEEQADAFLKAADFSNGTPLLLAADFETSKSTPTLYQLMQFMKIVDSASPAQCVLYSGNLIRETLRPLAGGHQDPKMIGCESFFQAHRLWLAEYGPHARIPYPWCEKITDGRTAQTPGVFLWQFTETGRVNPLTGVTDGNFFDGSFNDLASRWIA
jgi:lysozyme